MDYRDYEEKLETFENIELKDGVVAVRFDLSDGDIQLSAQLAEAACDGKWDEVKQLLKQGADPRICRITDGVGCYSPVFYAIRAQKYGIAVALYNAGDRLDDICMDPQENPGKDALIPDFALRFLADEMDYGRNYFTDGTKNVSECIRCGQFGRANRLLDSQGSKAEDLNYAAVMAIHSAARFRYKIEEGYETLKRLLSLGADLSKSRTDLLNLLDRFKKFPVVMRPNVEYLDKMTALLK